jgi:hypothetical protein
MKIFLNSSNLKSLLGKTLKKIRVPESLKYFNVFSHLYQNQKYSTMLHKVLVHAKLCEQWKHYPDSTNECRAKSLISENYEKTTMHKQ